jgi:hypothetical protein
MCITEYGHAALRQRRILVDEPFALRVVVVNAAQGTWLDFTSGGFNPSQGRYGIGGGKRRLYGVLEVIGYKTVYPRRKSSDNKYSCAI